MKLIFLLALSFTIGVVYVNSKPLFSDLKGNDVDDLVRALEYIRDSDDPASASIREFIESNGWTMDELINEVQNPTNEVRLLAFLIKLINFLNPDEKLRRILLYLFAAAIIG